MDSSVMTIAVLGGTGKEGSGLAMRWARSGYRVIIGSRSEEKARRKAEELNRMLGEDYFRGAANRDAAAVADIIVLTVPYSAQKAILADVAEHLKGKVLVNVSVPLKPPDVTRVHLPPGGSAAQEAQEQLGADVKVVAAFQNISARHLEDPNRHIACDVLVCGDDESARREAIHLAEAAGMRGIDAGPLANAIAVEALTPVLLHINRHYRIKDAGIRITGLDLQRG